MIPQILSCSSDPIEDRDLQVVNPGMGIDGDTPW